MNSKHSFRYLSLGLVFAFLGLAIIARLIHIQVGPPHEDIQKVEENNGIEWLTMTPTRGNIYDRKGRLLAGSQLIYEVAIELYEGINPETIALATSVELGLDYFDVLGKASQDPDRGHITLDNFVSYEDAQSLIALKQHIFENPEEAGVSTSGLPHSLWGLSITPRLDRSYPEHDLGSNFLGFVNKEGVSAHGVEEKLHWLLSGVEKTERISTDPYRALELPDIPDGADVILTIDREIQDSMEELLDSYVGTSGAQAGTIIVMSPKTGEILAMASNPRMDLFGDWQFTEIFQGNQTYNMAMDIYEPGSVFKIVTMAAALDAGVVVPETEYLDRGVYPVDGWDIRNWNGGAWGPQTMTTCMEHSLNVCLAYVAVEELGPTRFYNYLKAFQFGQPTGIGLAREYSGLYRSPGDGEWREIDLATNSYGQGIIVTPLQMLRAVSAVANKGSMVTPHILKAVVNQGHQYTIESEIAGSPISPETARTLSEMLATIVESESYTKMNPDYRVAGKTGTGTIYDSNLTNTSFIGWGPVDDAEFMVYIWLNKPTSSPWASLVTGPIFREAVDRLVVLMDIPPDAVRLSMNAD
jgi:cell division protein FtsI/penicillin-binding protein 2